MASTNELRGRRATLLTEARGLLDRASADGALGAEDGAQYDRIVAEIDALKGQIERSERLDAELREVERPIPTIAARTEQPGETRTARETFEYRGRTIERASGERRRAQDAWFRGGWAELADVERRALQADSDTIGGYLRPDQEFVARLIQGVDNDVYVQSAATVMVQATADSIGFPSLDTDPSDPSWTSELLTGSADSTMAFGKREMRPHPLAKRILVSNKLLRQTAGAGAVNAENLVLERLRYVYATTAENAYLNGSGAGQPLGVFTASALGISTGRDVSTDNTATSITSDGLINAKYALKPQYRRGASWLFHTDALKQISKLKDGDGQYIWQPGLVNGTPDRLLNLPYLESQYAPNTFTSALYVGLLGDWSYYWIVMALDMQIQRVVELYAATNQTGFICRMEADGAPVLEEAFVRVKLG